MLLDKFACKFEWLFVHRGQNMPFKIDRLFDRLFLLATLSDFYSPNWSVPCLCLV